MLHSGSPGLVAFIASPSLYCFICIWSSDVRITGCCCKSYVVFIVFQGFEPQGFIFSSANFRRIWLSCMIFCSPCLVHGLPFCTIPCISFVVLARTCRSHLPLCTTVPWYFVPCRIHIPFPIYVRQDLVIAGLPDAQFK